MIDFSVLATQKWSFVNFYDSKCKSSWICKLYFNIATILYATQVPLNNTFPFGSKSKIPVNSLFARLSWWKMNTFIYTCECVSGDSCELLSPALKVLCNVHNSLFFNIQIRVQVIFFLSAMKKIISECKIAWIHSSSPVFIQGLWLIWTRWISLCSS